MKCTRKGCSKEAEYVIDGQSVCNDHWDNDKEPEAEEGSMGDRLAGNTGNLEL